MDFSHLLFRVVSSMVNFVVMLSVSFSHRSIHTIFLAHFFPLVYVLLPLYNDLMYNYGKLYFQIIAS